MYFLKLFDQVVMFSNSKNNTDGVYSFCEINVAFFLVEIRKIAQEKVNV